MKEGGCSRHLTCILALLVRKNKDSKCILKSLRALRYMCAIGSKGSDSARGGRMLLTEAHQVAVNLQCRAHPASLLTLH